MSIADTNSPEIVVVSPADEDGVAIEELLDWYAALDFDQASALGAAWRARELPDAVRDALDRWVATVYRRVNERAAAIVAQAHPDARVEVVPSSLVDTYKTSIWAGSTVATVARLLTAALLVGLLLRGDASREAQAPLEVTAATSTAELAAARAARPDRALAWSDSASPGLGVLALLAGAARAGTPVTLRHVEEPPPLRVEPPLAPVAMRRAALDVTLRGEAGERITVVLDDGAAQSDSVVLTVGTDGVARASVAVLPTRPGAATWSVRAGSHVARAHAWVRAESPVRALVLTGPPTWESRFVVRALESAGMRVAVHQALGRGQAVVAGNAAVPRTLEDLSDHDVVLVLDGEPGPELLGLLGRWVAESGGGVLLSPAPPSAPGPWLGWAAAGSNRTVDAGALAWSGPAEVEPLPSAALRFEARPVAAPASATAVASLAGPGGEPAVLLAVAEPGRGRVAVSGLETWRWRMEAGHLSGHEAFWSSLVEWLAEGLTSPWTLASQPAAPGVAWTGRLEGDVPDSLGVADGARREVIPVLPAGPRAAALRFVPTAEGGYALGADASHGAVVRSAHEPASWSRAALTVGGAGGVLLGPTAGPGDVASRPVESRRPWLLFLTLALLATTGWTARRLGGAP
ncbi:MAG: hypothetical protein KY453_10755 [Gemmatimonadetes bacterium]|nr:hypothetical protein [Gemmatimonadota bacterium]